MICCVNVLLIDRVIDSVSGILYAVLVIMSVIILYEILYYVH